MAEVSNIQMSSEREHLTQDRSLPNQYNVYPPPAPPPQSDASIFFLGAYKHILLHIPPYSSAIKILEVLLVLGASCHIALHVTAIHPHLLGKRGSAHFEI